MPFPVSKEHGPWPIFGHAVCVQPLELAAQAELLFGFQTRTSFVDVAVA
jgi:hypothetical protein